MPAAYSLFQETHYRLNPVDDWWPFFLNPLTTIPQGSEFKKANSNDLTKPLQPRSDNRQRANERTNWRKNQTEHIGQRSSGTVWTCLDMSEPVWSSLLVQWWSKAFTMRAAPLHKSNSILIRVIFSPQPNNQEDQHPIRSVLLCLVLSEFVCSHLLSYTPLWVSLERQPIRGELLCLISSDDTFE